MHYFKKPKHVYAIVFLKNETIKTEKDPFDAIYSSENISIRK